MRSYEKLGQWKAILLSGLFFGMFHFNLQNLLGPILLGIIIGYIVIRTNSIWMGIYAHMLNNAIAVFLSFFFTKTLSQAPDGPGGVVEITTMEIIASLVLLAMIASFFGVLCYLGLKKLKKITEHKHDLLTTDHSLNYGYEGKSGFGTWIPIVFFLIMFFGMAALYIAFIRSNAL